MNDNIKRGLNLSKNSPINKNSYNDYMRFILNYNLKSVNFIKLINIKTNLNNVKNIDNNVKNINNNVKNIDNNVKNIDNNVKSNESDESNVETQTLSEFFGIYQNDEDLDNISDDEYFFNTEFTEITKNLNIYYDKYDNEYKSIRLNNNLNPFMKLTVNEVKVELREYFTGAESEKEEMIKNVLNKKGFINRCYFEFSPYNPKFIKCDDGVIIINRFAKTKIWTKCEAVKKNGLKNTNFDFIHKYPRIKALFYNLFSNDERVFYVLNWLSYIMNEVKKTQNTILINGMQGTGKNVFFENIISYFFGDKFCPMISNDEIKSRFTPDGLENALFVCFNEVKGDFKDGNTTYEKLKTYITDDIIRIEKKGRDNRNGVNSFNCVFFSNNNVPLQIQTNDRRYNVFKAKDESLINVALLLFREEIEIFLDKLKNERDGFLIDLFCYEYNKFKARRLLETEEKKAIIESSELRINLFFDKVKKCDITFYDEILNGLLEDLEICEKNENILNLVAYFFNIKEKQITASILKSHFEELKNRMLEYPKNYGFVLNSDLIFIYRLYMEKITENLIQVGKTLNLNFGTKQKKINGKNFKVRYCNYWLDELEKKEMEEIPF